MSNPFFIRIPLVNPDRILDAMLPWVKWLLTPAIFVLWVLLCGIGGYHVIARWDEFAAATSGVLVPSNWLYLLAAWLALKVVHETFHGLVCKRYGGTIPCAGVVLILFSPVAFVDVTSSWRFGSKWQRIFTAAAGMYVEFAIAAVAAIIWSRTSPGVVHHIAYSVVLMASLTTMLFNANPLMRFDGYYILADLLEIQNLYSSGRQYLKYFFLRRFFGAPASLPAWPRARRLFIAGYAWGSLFWRVMVSVSMAIVATTLFHGAGLVLTGVAAVTWLGMPVGRFLKYLVVGDVNGRPPLRRFLGLSAIGAALVVAALGLPWPGGATAPGIVEFAPLDFIRVSGAGFVRQICVRLGQRVREGQVLAVLVNEQLERDLEVLKLAIEQSEIQSRILHRGGDMAKYQVEHENRLALIKQRNQLEKQLREMTLRAPRAGQVIGQDLDSLIGRYVEVGTSLMAIGVQSQKEVRLSISEPRLATFTKSVGTHPYLRVRGRSQPIRSARLAKIEPRASVKVDYPALGGRSGGPLAVRSVADNQDQSGDDVEMQLEYVAPRFTGIVDLPQDVARSLRAGELVRARLMDHDDTIGNRLYQTISHWVRKRLRPGRTS